MNTKPAAESTATICPHPPPAPPPPPPQFFNRQVAKESSTKFVKNSFKKKQTYLKLLRYNLPLVHWTPILPQLLKGTVFSELNDEQLMDVSVFL